MQRRIPLTTLLRFPILFGGLLVAGSTAFIYRDKFKEDVDAKRVLLIKENADDRRLIEGNMIKKGRN